VLEASSQRIVDTVPDDALVLDIGGWAKPFPRADWVLDTLPYETRGLYGYDGPGAERFTSDTWVCRDICDRTPFPFADKQFDFVICSHTLEDLRDPIWVCEEINRIGKAGYLEVPSRLEEQSYGIQGPWVGWGHHHWLVDITDGRIDFSFKHHIIHGRPELHFPAGFHAGLAKEDCVAALWWDGGFECGERLFIVDPAELDGYLGDFVQANIGRVQLPNGQPADKARAMVRKALRRLGV